MHKIWTKQFFFHFKKWLLFIISYFMVKFVFLATLANHLILFNFSGSKTQYLMRLENNTKKNEWLWKDFFCSGKHLRHVPHPPNHRTFCSFSRDSLLGNFISCSSVVSWVLCTRCSSQPNRLQITTAIQLWASHWARAISERYCLRFSASAIGPQTGLKRCL